MRFIDTLISQLIHAKNIDIIISDYLDSDISLPDLSSSMLMNQKKVLHTNKKKCPMHVLLRNNSFSDQNTIKNIEI